MVSRVRLLHKAFAAALALFGVAAVLVPLLATTPASAQGFFGWGDQRRRPAPPPQPSFNPFGIFEPPPPDPNRERPPVRRKDAVERPPAESNRAPAARRPEGTPTTNVVVIGDSMADWLAYGLEDVYSDNADVGVVRKNRANAGLIRHELRNEALDWVQSTKEYLAAEKPNFIVIMMGAADRQAIRERPAKPPAQPANPENPGQPPSIVAAPPAAPATYEFRSDRWAEVYAKRVDDMIAVLKAKGVPVIWVGLPVIRGARGKADVQYLNDLYKSHAEKAGITYVDVWDGFADENGDYAQYGPDYDGQTRRLRNHDGVHFTKAGAVKLAHLVERDLDRLIQAKAAPVVAVPAPEQPATTPSGPAPRPDIGPVVSLTATPPQSEGLAGSGQPRPATDPVASRVLVKGDTVNPAPGRADDFAWPRSETAADANDVIPIVAPAPTAARPAPTAKNPTPERATKRPGQAAATPPAKRQVQ
jgi:uncharacterized protein